MPTLVFRTLSGITLAVLVACAMCACSMDPPKSGVQIKVTNTLTDEQADALVKILKGYDSGISSHSRMIANGVTTINLSPVSDIQAFSAKITCGTIQSTNGNVITLDVDTTKLGLPVTAAPESEDSAEIAE